MLSKGDERYQGPPVGSLDFAQGLLAASLHRFESFEQAMEEPLRQVLNDVRGRWCRHMAGDDPYARFFLGTTGTPAFQLLAWIAEAVLPESARSLRAEAAGEAMLCLYFSARCQDDRVDEAADAKLTYLEQVLSARALRLLVEASGEPLVMLAQWESNTLGFAGVAYRDAQRRSSAAAHWGEDELTRQGSKYLPMALAPAALLIAAGRADELPALQRSVEQWGLGLQLSNDIFGAERDLATKQSSPFLAELGLERGEPVSALLPAVRRTLRKGRLGRLFVMAVEALRGGLAPLAHLTGARMVEHIARRIQALEAHYNRLCMQAVFQVPELVADLEVTRRCNLRCPACFVFAQEESGHRLPELPTPLLLELLEELSGYRTHLHLTGGEAFLHRGLWEVLEAAAMHGMQDITINTNGSHLDMENLRRLASLPIRVRLLVSIDGPPGVQETARQEGMTRKALDALRAATEAGVEAEPATILTSELVNYGVDRWFDHLAQVLGRKPKLVLWPLFLKPGTTLSAAEGGSMLDAAHLREAARQIAGLILSPAEVVVADYPVINPLLARLGVPPARLWQCNAGRGRLAVQADGMISPCHPFRLSLGRISPGQVRGFVQRTLHHPHYIRLGQREHDGCSGCPEKAICGNCQAIVVGKGGALFSNDRFCEDALGPVRAQARE